MDPAVTAAWIAAAVAIATALASAYLTIWGTLRQRAVDLVVAALSHMGGGIQERSAGVAALMAMRGPLDRRPRFVDRGGWEIYGPAIGQQLYRQLVYVLNNGKGKYQSHEVENIIVMIDWLLRDKDLLAFKDRGQMRRIAVSIRAYVRAYEGDWPTPTTGLQGTSFNELASRIRIWLKELGDEGPINM